MNFSRPKWHLTLTIAALAVAIAALPFSVALCHAGLILFLINWVIEGNWNEKWNRIKFQKWLWPFFVMFLLSLVGLLQSADVGNGWFSLEKKIFFFILPVVIASIDINEEHVRFLFKTFIATCAIACITCLTVGIYHISSPEGRIVSNFDLTNAKAFSSFNPHISSTWSFLSYLELTSGIGLHPTYFGIYLLFAILLLSFFYSSRRKPISQYLIAGLFSLFSLFILMLSARIITLLYVMMCVIVIWKSIPRRSVSITLIVFTLLLSLGSVVINPVARYRSLQEELVSPFRIEENKTYITSSSIRLSLWWLSWQSLKEGNWLVGQGTGDVMDVIKTTAKKNGVSNALQSFDPHNQFLFTLLASGVIGLTALLACLTMPLFNPDVSYFHFVFAGVIFIACLTESVLEQQKGIVFFSIFHSLFAVHFRPAPSPPLTLAHA